MTDLRGVPALGHLVGRVAQQVASAALAAGLMQKSVWTASTTSSGNKPIGEGELMLVCNQLPSLVISGAFVRAGTPNAKLTGSLTKKKQMQQEQ